MRSLLALLWAGLVLIWAPVAFAAIGTPTTLASGTFISSGATKATTVDAPVGSLVVAFVQTHNGAANITGCSLSSGDALTQAITNNHATTRGLYIFYASNTAHDLPVGGTISCTTSSGSWMVGMYVVSGANGGLDTHVAATEQGGVSSQTVSTGTLANSSEIVFGGLGANSSLATFTEASGFSRLSGASDGFGFDNAYQIVSATTSVSYSPSSTTTGTWSAVVVSFQATAVASGLQTRALLGVGQ